MGKIGTEAGRTLKLKREGEDFQAALLRALDLFDATVELLIINKSHRTREVLLARDQFLQALFISDDPSIEVYSCNLPSRQGSNGKNSGTPYSIFSILPMIFDSASLSFASGAMVLKSPQKASSPLKG